MRAGYPVGTAEAIRQRESVAKQREQTRRRNARR